MEQEVLTENVALSGAYRPVIVHCADLHIDTPFSNFPPNSDKAKIRREEQLGTFSRIVSVAREIHADFLLIAGDLFDAARVSNETLDFINDRFKENPDITICIAPGNHDPYVGGSPYKTYDWAPNVNIFDDQLSYVEKNGVRIYGRAFTGHFARTPLLRMSNTLPKLEASYINILLMHGDIFSSSSVYNPIDVNDFSRCGFDYVALGHIHANTKIKYAGSVPYCYCGTPEGRGFDEPGECGVMLCKVGKRASSFQFAKTNSRSYITREIDISGCENNEEICSIILQLCPQDENLYKVILKGRLPENFGLSAKRIQTLIEDKYFYLTVKDRTETEVDTELLQKEVSLRGLFVKNVYASDLSDEMKEEVLKSGLQAFEGEVIVDDN